MLFLLNDIVTEVEAPEMRLLARSKLLGVDVLGLRPREAMDLARRKLQACHDRGGVPDAALVSDLAALIIAKTGANAALFPVHEGRVAEARLTILPEAILENVRTRYAEGDRPDIRAFWTRAA
ncbi:hypothetical protein [Hyphomonas sp.]|uniref:hypothetical protein n=1 Tax=Hyphomonas sp. TaxID=87 RepID=UPI0039199B8B